MSNAKLFRGSRILIQELEMIMPVTDPMKCIAKIANKAKLSEKSKRMAIDVMKDICKYGGIRREGSHEFGSNDSLSFLPEK